MVQVRGLARDSVRSALLAGLRVRGDFLGDWLDPRHRDDPYPLYRRIRDQGRVAVTPIGPMTADHVTCDRILRHPETTTATAGHDNLPEASWFERWMFGGPDRGDLVDPLGPESMIGTDAPDHTRLRRLVSRVFTPSSIADLRPRLTAIAEELVDTARQQDSFDLMADVAHVFPVRAICEVLGIPEADHRRFKEWGSDLAVDLDLLVPAHRQRAAIVALRELSDYLSALLRERRRDPGDDLLSRLVQVEEDGDQLTERELLATCLLLLVAGFETTVNLVGNGTLALVRHRDQLDWLREDLTRVPLAVEELLRFDSPVQLSVRNVAGSLREDLDELPEGGPVLLVLGGANRDPDVFPDPDRLDLARPNARRHLAFASGPHYCLGAALARLEGEIALTTLLDRMGDLRLAGRPRRRPTFVLRGLDSLPLVSTPR